MFATPFLDLPLVPVRGSPAARLQKHLQPVLLLAALSQGDRPCTTCWPATTRA